MVRGDRLRQLRLALGLTQVELASLCRIGLSQIHRYEYEKTDISGEHLAILAEKLGVSTDYLLGLADEPKGLAAPREIKRDERELLDIYRRDGWVGVLRLVTERIAEQMKDTKPGY